ncbi:MAG: BMP family ABC transporter substrate-binding protein [Clostridia bacterium]|nr:BMP family ABC transporter substrate-binding protein [Clostridia bacterium]
MKKPVILLFLLACLALSVHAFAAAGTLSLPAGTQTIESEAFRGCKSLTGVLAIPDGVTEIGAYAFAGCTRLTGVPKIPGSVKRIGAHAFDGCTGLSGLLYLPENVSVASTAFTGCTGLTLTRAEYRVAVVGDSAAPTNGTLHYDAWQAVSAWCSGRGLPCAWYCGDIDTPVLEGFNVIVTVGSLRSSEVRASAMANPSVRYICLDAEMSSPANNVFASLYRMDQAGFMAGYAAVRMGFRSLGFMGGMETDDVVSCGQGFIRGANAAARELGVTGSVTVAYTCTGTFSAGPGVYATADLWYRSGVEVILSCGGGIIDSIRQAAVQNNGHIIGTDSDCSVFFPEAVTSALKRVGVTAVDALSRLISGSWGQLGGTNPRLGVISGDPAANHVGLPGQYSGGFTASLYRQMVNKLCTGTWSPSGSVQITVTSGPASPAAPTITQITARRDGSVSITWSAVPGASSYTLYYAEAEDGALMSGSRIPGITETHIDLSSLRFKTEYLFAVTASVGNNETPLSVHARARVRGINYRALLIGQVHYPDETCNRNGGDCDLMYSMLTSRFTPIGTRYRTPSKYIDRSANDVLSLVDSTFAGADNDDVSLFFIATHGDSVTTYREWEQGPGSLNCVNSARQESWLLLYELADKLDSVPGEVIVVIESCGAGAAVYDPAHPDQQNSASGLTAGAIVNAFPDQKLDRAEDLTYIYDENGNGQIVQSRIGEFRVPDKFYVLCATRYLQDSWGTEDAPAHNYFTQWLTGGVGTSGRMPADSDRNGILTLNELFSYISTVGDRQQFGPNGATQQVQVYPAGSTYELFRAEPIY